MGNAVSGAGAAAAALCAAISAIEFVNLLDPPSGAGAAQSPLPPPGAVRELLLLAAAGVLFTAFAFIHRLLHHAGGPGAGAGADNWRVSDLLNFVVCASVGLLEFLIFVEPASGMDPGEQARALGLAALHALPAAATGTFFLGMLLIVVRHIRAGGEGGGGAIAGAGHGLIQATEGLLNKMALAAAATLVCLMSTALYAA